MTIDSLLSVRWKKNMQIPFSSSQELGVCLLTARDGYQDLKTKFETDPTAADTDIDVNNPLNQSESNPWTQKFKDIELKTTINLDVTRTFPSIALFRERKVQELLEGILFLWCKLNPDVGYRQGMHELVAVIYYVVCHDARSKTDPMYDLVIDDQFVEHDSGILFLSLMRSVKPWYEVNQSEYFNKENVTPVIATCKKIHYEIIQVLDRDLFTHLDFLSIEPQLYGIANYSRWLRLLFSREFEMEDLIILWDGIFEYSYNLCLVEWVCAAMLLAIKKSLVKSDYSATLTLLMHYPRLSDIGMSIQDLLESAKRLKAVYDAKTYTISTTPRIMDNLDKAVQGFSSKSTIKWTPQGYKAKLDALNELETYKQELSTLKQNNNALDRRLSRLKARDTKIILSITAVIQNLKSLSQERDMDVISQAIEEQCDSLNSLAESLKHSATEFSESSTLIETQDLNSQNLDGDIKRFIQLDLDNSSSNALHKAASKFRTSVEGINKVIFGGPETTSQQVSVIKMQPKISSNHSSNDELLSSSSDIVVIDQGIS